MPNAIVLVSLMAALVLPLLVAVPPAAAATYTNDYIPKRSDSYRHRIGHMENESKQRARAGAEYMRRDHLGLL
jgi:hypothetical protein